LVIESFFSSPVKQIISFKFSIEKSSIKIENKGQ